MVGSYLKKGFTFFAAKIASQAAKKEATVPEVRFTFDRTKTEPIYPMRISAFNRFSPLDTTIWIIAEDGTYLPRNYPTAEVTGDVYSEESYRKALDKVMAQNAGRTFAIQYAGNDSVDDDNNTRWKRSSAYSQHNRLDSFKPSPLQGVIGYPSQHVVRLRARLNPNGMTEDLVLEKTASPRMVSGWYQTPCPGGVKQEKCPGDADSGCQLGGAPGVSAAPALLVGMLLALGLRRRRR
jgi:hypothetical protein